MTQRGSGIFYGWWVVGVAALAQAVSVGSTFYAYSTFLKPVAAEFGASRTAVTLGLSLFVAFQGLLGPFLGRALDRFGARGLMTIGVVVEALGLALLSIADQFWQAAVLFIGIIGFGSYLFSPIATISVVSSWFVRRRGRAVGFTTIGSSLGGVFFPIVSVALIERFGWRNAAFSLGAIVLALAVPLILLMRGRPEELALAPDGDPLAESHAATSSRPLEGPPPPAASTGSLFRSRNLWAITMTIGIAYLPVNVLLVHLYPYATDLGIEPARAARLMSCVALTSGLGRVFFGTLADQLDKRAVCCIAYAGFALGWACFLRDPDYARMLVGAAFAGLSLGGIMPLWSTLIGAAFGRAAFGRAMGFANFLMIPFSIGGAPLAGWVFDETGSYELAFTAFLACLPLAASMLLLLRLPSVEPGRQAAT